MLKVNNNPKNVIEISGEDHEAFMLEALKEAKKAAKRKEVPVGAVVVRNGVVIAGGSNAVIRKNDPTAHAEILAVRKAGRITGNYRLPECDLYVTLEPCAMCLGAMIQARIRRLFFGALDPKSGAVESLFRLPIEKTNHRIEIKGGILADECGKILKDFFRNRR